MKFEVEMSGDKKESVLGQIVVAVVVAILAGGTSPWWWNSLFPNNQQSPKINGPSPSSTMNDGKSTSSVVSQSPPKPPLALGTYSPENGGSLFKGSGRHIATVGSKACIAIVDSRPSPYEGYSKVSVSRMLWRNNSFYTNATDQPLVIHSNTSFSEGEVGRFTPLWSLSQARIIEPYQTLLNDCLQSNDDEYKFNKIDNFREGISFNGSQQENPRANTSPPSGILKVQNLLNGDYFFSTQQPPFNNYSNFLLLRKKGNTIIGWTSEGGSGNCFRKVIRSSSEVETTHDDPLEGKQSTKIEDGIIGGSGRSQFNTNQYSDFDRVLRPCMKMFSN
ncbi:hypothetical protein [Phormidesmis sp. 146-33]